LQSRIASEKSTMNQSLRRTDTREVIEIDWILVQGWFFMKKLHEQGKQLELQVGLHFFFGKMI
jgi:hypothetical protein